MRPFITSNKKRILVILGLVLYFLVLALISYIRASEEITSGYRDTAKALCCFAVAAAAYMLIISLLANAKNPRLKKHVDTLAAVTLLFLVVISITAAQPYLKREVYVYKGVDLPSTLVGNTDEKTVSETNAGYLTYGPYVNLGAKQYRFTVNYRCDASDSNYFDITSNSGQVVYYTGFLTPEAHSFAWTLDFDAPVSEVELRVFYDGLGSLSVDSIRIEEKVNPWPGVLRAALITAAVMLVLFLLGKLLESIGVTPVMLPFRKRLLMVLLPAGVFAFTIPVTGAIDVYTANYNEFWFSFHQLLPCIITSFVLVFVIAVLVGVFLNGLYYKIYLSLLAVIALALYIQGNFLPNDFGVLDGRPINWSLYRPQLIVSTIVWCVCIIGSFFAVKYTKHMHIGVFSALLIVMQLLVGVLRLVSAPYLSGNGDFYFSNEDMFAASKSQNAVIFVLDTFDRSCFDSTIEENPEYQKDFSDFVYFPNMVAGGAPTHYGIPCIMTGEHFLGNTTYEEYKYAAYSANPIFEVLHNNDYNIRAYSGSEYFCSDLVLEEFDNAVPGTLRVTSYSGLRSTYYRLILFKYAPQVLKPMFWLSSTELAKYAGTAEDSPNNYLTDDVAFYQNMVDSGLHLIDTPVFCFYHLFGVHGPYTITEDIKRVEESSSEQASKASLNIVKRYLSMMQETGVYDNSLIIVMADHGSNPQNAYETPLFMIKRPGAKAETIQVNNAPACFLDVMPTVAAELGMEIPPNKHGGMPVFDIPENAERVRLHIADGTLTELYAGENVPSGAGAFEVVGSALDNANLHYMGDVKEYYDNGYAEKFGY